MSETSVRLSLQTGEFEVSGPEAFTESFRTTIEELLAKLVDSGAQAASPASAAASVQPPSAASSQPAGSFAEALLEMPKGSSGTDQILLAGSYAAATSADSTFSTAEASALLVEQGVKLSNPSQSMTNALKAKRVFKVGNRWRISRNGEDHLRTLVPGAS